MSHSASSTTTPLGSPAVRPALMPYAEPASGAGAAGLPGQGHGGDGAVASRVRVGPFVPASHRTVAQRPAVATPSYATAVPEAPAARESAGMAVPASIPPYRPLRPTPIVTPAMRTPLYIPTVLTPAEQAVVEDEGTIDPQLVSTAEYAVPASDAAESDVPSSAPATTPTPTQELPWIDAFLASTPPLPMTAVPTPDASLRALTPHFSDALPALPTDASESAPEAVTPPVDAYDVPDVPYVSSTMNAATIDEATIDEATIDEATIDEAAAMDGASSEAAADDVWPLDEAAAEFHALSAQLEGDTAARASDQGAEPPLAPWSDDDLMDIMPVTHSGKTPLSNTAIVSDGELWAERARKAHEEAQVFRAMASARADERGAPSSPSADATAEEAAHALEVLARRVRAGELTLPSYDPRMGEPAALVAALAAILGVRLR